jgi:hypothetical protein
MDFEHAKALVGLPEQKEMWLFKGVPELSGEGQPDANGWYSVNDALPPEWKVVVWADGYNTLAVGYLHDGWVSNGDHHAPLKDTYTHWLPIGDTIRSERK